MERKKFACKNSSILRTIRLQYMIWYTDSMLDSDTRKLCSSNYLALQAIF